jgi:hypothetical protein
MKLLQPVVSFRPAANLSERYNFLRDGNMKQPNKLHYIVMQSQGHV